MDRFDVRELSIKLSERVRESARKYSVLLLFVLFNAMFCVLLLMSLRNTQLTDENRRLESTLENAETQIMQLNLEFQTLRAPTPTPTAAQPSMPSPSGSTTVVISTLVSPSPTVTLTHTSTPPSTPVLTATYTPEPRPTPAPTHPATLPSPIPQPATPSPED
jgi:hypothetical protein